MYDKVFDASKTFDGLGFFVHYAEESILFN